MREVIADVAVKGEAFIRGRAMAEESAPERLRAWIESNLELIGVHRKERLAFLEIGVNSRGGPAVEPSVAAVLQGDVVAPPRVVGGRPGQRRASPGLRRRGDGDGDPLGSRCRAAPPRRRPGLRRRPLRARAGRPVRRRDPRPFTGEPTAVTSLNGTRSALDVAHLRKVYGDTVAEGEIFGILGPNGAGKTTTVECVIGLRHPDAGQIRVLGLDPVGDAPELHQLIGAQRQRRPRQRRHPDPPCCRGGSPRGRAGHFQLGGRIRGTQRPPPPP